MVKSPNVNTEPVKEEGNANLEQGDDSDTIACLEKGTEEEKDADDKATNAAFLSHKSKARSGAEIVNEHQARLLAAMPAQVNVGGGSHKANGKDEYPEEDSTCVSSVTMQTFLPPLGTLYPSARNTQLELQTMQEEEMTGAFEEDGRKDDPVGMVQVTAPTFVSSKGAKQDQPIAPRPMDKSALGGEMRLLEQAVDALIGSSDPANSLSQPGASAFVNSAVGADENYRTLEDERTGPGEDERTGPDEDGTPVPVANAVEEGMVGLDLPQAEQYSSGNESSLEEKTPTTVLVLTGFLVVAVGLSVLFGVLLFLPESSSDESTETVAPTLDYRQELRIQVLDTFQMERLTLESLEDDASAQSQALQWILEDPLVETYASVGWRR